MLYSDTGSFCRWCGTKIHAYSTHFCTMNTATTSAGKSISGVMEELRSIKGDVKSTAKEAVNHPDHYAGEIECIDAIQAALTPEEFKGFCKGNALKYIWREGKKDESKQEISKGVWYMNRMITDTIKKKS
ncbi:hypothetical protein SB5439_05109 [Klebsiella variicola]|uniref:DUF3310 domain-containing protein n=1 Tax=Klebsiella variicola TaxID=244366 RepID=UPI00109C69C6|nr:DUF3310 domain-containing protein [Klebsiella variicola]VGQ12879.1 hypothetical protein SB5439_05109 [Klebsiella variicola]